jgi:hypothetical protein
MTRNLIQPNNILLTLNDKRKESVMASVIEIKQVSNAHQRYKKFVRGLR